MLTQEKSLALLDCCFLLIFVMAIFTIAACAVDVRVAAVNDAVPRATFRDAQTGKCIEILTGDYTGLRVVDDGRCRPFAPEKTR